MWTLGCALCVTGPGAARQWHVMTLGEFNAIRRRVKLSGLALGLAFLAMALSGAARSVTAVCVSLAVMGVTAYLMRRGLRQMDTFRCPQCGQDPLLWVSPDPTDDVVCYDQTTDHCLHCKAKIGHVD